MKTELTQAEISALRKRYQAVKSLYYERNNLFVKYEDAYFMRGISKPKSSGVDGNDWIVTASPGGRDKVTGLKRILDTSEIHIKVKDKGEAAQASDKIEAALKTILKVSGEYRMARVERDTNLASILYGPVVLSADSVDDIIAAKDGEDVNQYVKKQLKAIRKRTPFLIDTINPKESYPEWGKYGMVGHLHEHTMKGMEIKEQFGADIDLEDSKDYTVSDFFHYDKRLVEAGSKTLFAGTWMTDGVATLPIFVRYAGGSTLFTKPEEQLESFLYAYVQGWYKNESLYWTNVFTRMYTQGLPGPTLIREPDDTSDITVDYRGGIKIITAKGRLENIPIVDGDVIQLKNLMDDQAGKSTIQEQTIGGADTGSTFSSYVMQVNAGKLPAVDPTEAQKWCYRDLFLHILQRIKTEGIDNELIDPEDIPDDIDIEVTLEPDLQQDDLRNAQIVAQLKNAGANVSDEWINTNLLKIADSIGMFQQKTKEDIRKAVVANVIQNPEIMQQFTAAAMGQGQQQPPPSPQGEVPGQIPPGYHQMPDGSVMPDSEMPTQPGQPNMEGMPRTDAMMMPNEVPQ